MVQAFPSFRLFGFTGAGVNSPSAEISVGGGHPSVVAEQYAVVFVELSDGGDVSASIHQCPLALRGALNRREDCLTVNVLRSAHEVSHELCNVVGGVTVGLVRGVCGQPNDAVVRCSDGCGDFEQLGVMDVRGYWEWVAHGCLDPGLGRYTEMVHHGIPVGDVIVGKSVHHVFEGHIPFADVDSAVTSEHVTGSVRVVAKHGGQLVKSRLGSALGRYCDNAHGSVFLSFYIWGCNPMGWGLIRSNPARKRFTSWDVISCHSAHEEDEVHGDQKHISDSVDAKQGKCCGEDFGFHWSAPFYQKSSGTNWYCPNVL